MIRKSDGFPGERKVVLPPLIINLQEQDPLTSSLFITDIGYYPKAEHHHFRRESGISEYVLIYCVDGSGWYRLQGKQYEVRSNQYFILPPDAPHEYGAAEGGEWTIYWLHFRGAHAAIYSEDAQTPQNINVAINSRISDRISIFEEILTTIQYGHSIEDLRYISSLLHHFLASMHYLTQFRRATTQDHGDALTDSRTTSIDIVAHAIHYMRENIERRIALSDVLHYVGYSQSHFSSEFRKKTGESPPGILQQDKNGACLPDADRHGFESESDMLQAGD